MNATVVFDEFKSKIENTPIKENDNLLFTAYKLVKQEITKSNYSIQKVRLAHEIFGYLGDKGLNDRIELMKKYLQHRVDSNAEDKFWANWELVDNLALLKRYKEMIKEQRLFLEWTKKNMELEYCIKVMFDSTQAEGWVHEKQEGEWFEIYFDLITRMEHTKQNRHDRVLYVETAAGLLTYNLKEYDGALEEIDRYRNILAENQSWSELNKFSIRRITLLLEVYIGKKQLEKYDKVVKEVISEIELYIKQYNQGLTINIEEVCDMVHEIGTCLMWNKRYQNAMALFEYAIEYQGVGVTHFFYAICIWASQKNREKTIYHLQMAELKIKGNGGLRARYIHMFLEQPEFEDIRDDSEFLSIFNTS